VDHVPEGPSTSHMVLRVAARSTSCSVHWSYLSHNVSPSKSRYVWSHWNTIMKECTTQNTIKECTTP
jgi:uncharacterized protein affecting Mg2+/Co2+ transport